MSSSTVTAAFSLLQPATANARDAEGSRPDLLFAQTRAVAREMHRRAWRQPEDIWQKAAEPVRSESEP
jgi:hypothetical protein